MKLFKSKRSKDKDRQRRAELREEEGILYGSSKPAHPPPAENNGAYSSAGRKEGRRRPNSKVTQSAIVRPTEPMGMDSSMGSMGSKSASSYGRGDSFEPGSTGERYGNRSNLSSFAEDEQVDSGPNAEMTQEEKDKFYKQRLKAERKKQSQSAASAKLAGSRNIKSMDERFIHSSFDEGGKRADAAQDEVGRKQPPAARGGRGEDEKQERRRRRREQEEKDRKIKDEVRKQKQQASRARSRRDDRKPGPAAASARDGTGDEDELEQRRRRRREQDEKDRKMKEMIKQQKAQASAARRGRSDFGTEQEGPGKREDAAKGSIDEEFERRREERHRKAGRRPKREQVAFDEPEPQSEDTFEAGLQRQHLRGKAGAATSEEETENDQADLSQNVIDMHIEQLRMTSKITTMEEEGHGEVGGSLNPNADLGAFEEQEMIMNNNRRASRRISATTMRIEAWRQKRSLQEALKLADRTPEYEWLSSIYRRDPRYQIMKFFNEVARDGGEAAMDENLKVDMLASLFNKASVFTVWRPTSQEAIKNMTLGVATGKGLDIKGKSAKKGNISSYVPFLQIFEEAHKEQVRTFIKDGKIVRVFYKTEQARDEANELIKDIKEFMLFAAQDAMLVLSDEFATEEEQQLAMKHLQYDDISLNVEYVDMYINADPPVYGLDITERLFWEAYVMIQYCDRPKGTEWDIGRGSVPAFMDFNLKSIRSEPPPGMPRAVVYQMCTESPMDPRYLLMAYEENGCVKPVVSDFDCFLLGSRGVKYKKPIPDDQVKLVQWSVNNISDVLDERAKSEKKEAWTDMWFRVLKKAALKGFYPKTPKYGNGDPKSYEIMECAVARLQSTGCVRHGAECFNWFFPQDIDDEFLVVSDTLPGNLKWKKVGVEELQEILIQKIDEGFTFPINPKWVLCDTGWRRVYDRLLNSHEPNVQDSIDCWLPPETGLREKIDAISARHPLGFGGSSDASKPAKEERHDRRLLEDELERYVKIQRAWRKLRLVLYWIRFVREKKREREELGLASSL